MMIKKVCLMLAVLLMVHLSCDAEEPERIGDEVYEPTTFTMILWDIRTAVQNGDYCNHFANIAALNCCYKLAGFFMVIGGDEK